MLGVAVDAAAGIEAERLLDGELKRAQVPRSGRDRCMRRASAWSWMLVWQEVHASRTDTNGWTWQARQLLASAAWPVDRLPLSHIRSP